MSDNWIQSEYHRLVGCNAVQTEQLRLRRLSAHKFRFDDSWAYHGQVTIDVAVFEPTSQIILHAQDLTITNAIIKYKGTEQAVANGIDTSTEGYLALRLSQEINTGNATLCIEFDGVVNDCLQGFYRAKHDPKAPSATCTTPITDGRDLYTLVTQFEPCDARRAFPCFDEPRLKATFDLQLEIPEEQTALANMPTADVSRQGCLPGTKRVRFETTPVMSTYLLAWTIGTFEYVEQMTKRKHQGKQIPVRVYTGPGYSQHAQFAVNYAANTLDYFAEIFGVDYPLPKCDHVVVPEFISGAMENWGLITYRPTKILFDPGTSDNRVKLKACYVIAHELAHQWFGNLVTMNWWSALWLNEGFATWAGYLAVVHFYPANVMSEAFHLDALKATHPIDATVGSASDAQSMFDDISYLKGASVIRMLSQQMGEDVFLSGIVVYLQKHAFRNTCTDDLFVALQGVTNKVNVAQFMESWIREPGFPVVDTTTVVNGQLCGCQSRFSPYSNPSHAATTWQIPLRVEDPASGQMETVVMAEKRAVISPQGGHGGDNTLLIPYDSTFCHINYSAGDLQLLLQRNRQGQHATKPTMSPEEIIPLLRDLRALTAAGCRSPIDLLNTCKALLPQQHQNVFIIVEVNRCIELLETAGAGSDRITATLTSFRQSIAEQQNCNVLWDVDDQGDYQTVEYQRASLQTLLARQDPATIHALQQHYEDWASGKTTSFAPSFRGAILGYAIATRGQAAYHKVMAAYISDTSVDGKEVCLAALCRVKEAPLVDELLDFVFSDQMTLQNIHLAFLGLGSNSHSRKALWEYMKRNWQVVYSRLSKSVVVLKWSFEMGLSHFDNLEVCEDIQNFLADKDTYLFDHSLSVVLDCIRANAAIRARLGPALSELFDAN